MLPRLSLREKRAIGGSSNHLVLHPYLTTIVVIIGDDTNVQGRLLCQGRKTATTILPYGQD